MQREQPKRGREPLGLRNPVAKQRGREHEQGRRIAGMSLPPLQERSENLDRLAEPHVVGQAGTQP